MTTKSARTRARILAAAQAEFSARGYQATTVRTVARNADIDPAMVIRYFGTKAGLFDAVCEISLRLPSLDEVPRADLGRRLVEHFLERWEGDPSDDGLLLLLRSATVEPEAVARLQRIFEEQLVPALAEVVADGDRLATRAALVSSQLLGLALTRHILRLPPMVALSRQQIVADVGPTIQRYLAEPLAGTVASV
jgi:AcrR family transcriptional regulator